MLLDKVCKIAPVRNTGKVDAQLLDDIALHLHDANFQKHLIRREDVQHVDDLDSILIARKIGRNELSNLI